MSDQTLLIPARPTPPRAALSFPRFLRAVRTNALTMWPDEAYETMMLRQSFLGRQRMLVNDPAAIHHILVDNTSNYHRTAATIRILRPITGQGLLLSEGEDWKLQRRTIAPALAPRVIPMLATHIAACTAQAVARLREAAAAGPVDLLAAMQTLALDIAGRSMFSLEVTRYGEAMRAAMNVYAENHARPYLLDMLLPPGIPSPRDFARRRFRRGWMALMDEIVQARLAAPAPASAPRDGGGPGAPRDLFDLLLAARDPETGAGFSREQLRDQVATMILAGHETTAVTLFWALVLLAQAPGAQAALAEEAAPLSFAEADAAATLPRLVRTRAVVSEALRLYPPAFTMARQASAADRAGGIDIAAGALILIAPWVLHRHRLLWRDPDAFDPWRFLPDAPPPPRLAYLPFGTGPRVCVGAQFALAEATLALGAVIRTFRVELIDTRPVLPVGIVTTQPNHAPLFRLFPR